MRLYRCHEWDNVSCSNLNSESLFSVVVVVVLNK